MKKSRLQELAGIKKPLNEGYAWERDENGALPTLESSTAKHAESMKEAGLATEATTNDLDLMRGVISKVQGEDSNILDYISDGYYALADNLPNLINDIQKAIKIHAKSLPVDMEEIKVLRNELKIYNDIRTLLDESTLGTIL